MEERLQPQRVDFFGEHLQRRNYLPVGNRNDQKDETGIKQRFADPDKIVFISAKQGLYTGLLKERMIDAVFSRTVQTENIIVIEGNSIKRESYIEGGRSIIEDISADAEKVDFCW